jgi:hypothetical protein
VVFHAKFEALMVYHIKPQLFICYAISFVYFYFN